MADYTETVGDHTFLLGEDGDEAERRATKIWKLKADDAVVTKECQWSPLALCLAKEIARGVTEFAWPPDEAEEETPEEYVELVDGIQRMFPSVLFVPSDMERYTEGGGDLEQIQRRLEEQKKLTHKKTDTVRLRRIYQLLKDVHQKIVLSSPSGPIDHLSVTQRELYEVAGNMPLKGRELSRRAGHHLNSHIKGCLSSLVKLGHLKTTKDGYVRESQD